MKEQTFLKYADQVYDIMRYDVGKEAMCLGSKEYNRKLGISNNLIPVLTGIGVIKKVGRGLYVSNTKGRFTRNNAAIVAATICNHDLLANKIQARKNSAIKGNLVRKNIIHPTFV